MEDYREGPKYKDLQDAGWELAEKRFFLILSG